MHRGVTYWSKGDDRRILYGTGNSFLIALDAMTRVPVSKFGSDGRIDLTRGLGVQVDGSHYGVTSYYGARRPGNNLYGESLVALRV